MSVRIGMDASVVRQAATSIDSRAADLDRVIGSVDGLVAEIAHNWAGEAAAEFHESWVHRHRAALSSLAGTLHGYARTARANADAQDRTSALSDDPIGTLRDWWEAGFTGILGGLTGATSAELHAARFLLPEARRLGTILTRFDRFGMGLGFVGVGADAAAMIYDGVRTGGTADETMNDELNLTLDAATLAAGAVNPLAGAAVGALALGVNALELVAPGVTADVFRLSPVGLGFEVGGAIADHIRDGDFNPIDIASQVFYDDRTAFVGLSNGIGEAESRAVGWVGQTAGDAAKDTSHALGGLVHDVRSWVHL